MAEQGPQDTRPVELSVAITCRDAAETIGVQLEALAAQEWSGSWELVVSDAGSTDGTLVILEDYADRFPSLSVVDASDGSGIAHGFNAAAAAARGEGLAFCEADDEVAPGWIAALAVALRSHELVACAAETEKLNEPWVRESRDDSQGPERGWFPPYLAHGSTLGLGIRRALFEKIDGFDESFPAMQDADLCYRAQLAGAELVFAPEAVVHYRFRTDVGGIFRQARLYAECFARLQRKYKPPGTRVPGQWKWPLKNWRPILAALPAAHRRGGRARLAWALGWQLGRIEGSVKHRVLAI